MIHQVISSVTARIRERSAARRQAFLARIQRQADQGKTRAALACGNLAHAVAASSCDEKGRILDMTRANVGIVTAYNDMLSAHQPYQGYPDIIKAALAELGHSAQVAGGVPAMCDGVTQGQPGMDMSLFSRDLIAQATALSLSHNTFDATLLLGICDKIAPGQIMGRSPRPPADRLRAGRPDGERHQQRREGEGAPAVRRRRSRPRRPAADGVRRLPRGRHLHLLRHRQHQPAGVRGHGPDAAGLRLRAPAQRAASCPHRGGGPPHQRHDPGLPGLSPRSAVIDERSLVNGLVALLASGGSTNHSIHMVALARAAGLHLTWDDISDLSDVVPLLVRMYPNGPADVNAFEQAGGVPGLMRRLAQEGLIHLDAPVFGGCRITSAVRHWWMASWCGSRWARGDASVLSPSGSVFQATGGTKLLAGNLGRAVVKVSAVAPEYRVIEAPARVFSSQHAVEAAYQGGRSQSGRRHRGAPQWPGRQRHAGAAQADAGARQPAKAGYKVALVTDGRLSGASGKIPPPSTSPRKRCTAGPSACLPMATCCGGCGKRSLDCLTDLSGRTQAEIDLTIEQEGVGP